MAVFLRVIGALLSGLSLLALIGALRVRSVRYSWLALGLIGIGLVAFHMSYWMEVLN